MPDVRLIDANALKPEMEILNAADMYLVCHIIDNAPTIEAEPVWHGRWIPIEYDSYADCAPVWDKWECSECGHEHSGEEDTLTAFCPNCGARMDGGKGGADNAHQSKQNPDD